MFHNYFSPYVMKCFGFKDEDIGDEDGDDKKKRQTRGGKGKVKAKKKSAPQKVCVSIAPRGKKKYVTIITGLASYGEWSWCICLIEYMLNGVYA